MALHIVHVHVQVKPGAEAAFRTATAANAAASRQEPGVVRFDLVQEQQDPTRFVIVEIYRRPEDARLHKETDHYRIWRDAVADLMAVPRSSTHYTNLDPGDDGWS